jgi:nucleoside-diphosphate-sugar epimerase
VTLSSAVIGIATHVGLDAFTHPGRPGVRLLGYDDVTVTLWGHTEPLAGVLQLLGHSVGSLVGLWLLAMLGRGRRLERWYGEEAVADARSFSLTPQARVLFWSLVAAGLLIGLWAGWHGDLVEQIQRPLVGGTIAVVVAAWLPLCQPCPQPRAPLDRASGASSTATLRRVAAVGPYARSMRVFFTGGSGKAGRHAIRHLVGQGHRVVNGDMVPLGEPGVADLRIDLTDSGQVFNALSAYAGFDELEPGTGVPKYDAVVHFAAVPAILVRPDNETFRVNTLSTYNVIDAAVKLGISKVIFASSETTYGVCFADGEVQPEYVPIDEEHPTVPHDSYAMSKVVNEVTARSFQARTGIDIYGLRINNVIEPHEYETKFPAFVADPALRRRNIFAYIDARDLGHMVDCCLRTDGLGYEVFNVSNDDTSVGITSDEVYERFYAGVPRRRDMGPFETFYANDKAKRLVGFAPQHSWRALLA